MKNNIINERALTKSSEPKDLLHNKNEKMIEAWAQKFFFHPVRVELNNQAKIILLTAYTSLIVFATISFFHLNPKMESRDKTVNIQIPPTTVSFNPEEMATVKIDSSQLALANKLLVDQLNSEISKSLDEREIKRNAVIRDKDEKIQLLNNRIEHLLLQIEAQNQFNSGNGAKNTSYSSENDDILKKEQEIIEREFKANQRVQKEAFMGLLDLNKLEDQKKMQTYLNQQQLDLYRLQKAFEKERREFRTKTFRVASAKSAEDYLKFLQD